VDTLNVTFLALSDPTRRVILDRLRRGAASVNELAEPFGVSQQAISKHLAYLERASLIEKRREGREQFCSLRAASLKQAYDWMDGYRQFWDGALHRLDVLLRDLQRPQRQRRKKHVRKRR
jgi:DNA-binding transcriptional ArsR family regulator